MITYQNIPMHKSLRFYIVIHCFIVDLVSVYSRVDKRNSVPKCTAVSPATTHQHATFSTIHSYRQLGFSFSPLSYSTYSPSSVVVVIFVAFTLSSSSSLSFIITNVNHLRLLEKCSSLLCRNHPYR
jgi:hypothetical protein